MLADVPVNQALAMQVLGLRLQIERVLPYRLALVEGLDELLARHPESKPAE